MASSKSPIEDGAAALYRFAEGASAAEAECLAALHKEALPPGWAPCDFETSFRDRNRAVLGIATSGGLCGLIVLQLAASEAEILTLAVREGWRRKGLGSALVSHAVEAARERGANRVYLETAEGNAAARSLYEGRGFVIIGRRVAYYRRRGTAAETALVMRLEIDLESAGARSHPA